MSSTGAAPRAVTVSHARAAASRKNGAKSRGPRTEAGKARSAQNALKHGLRAAKHLVLPAEDPAAFRALEAALLEELAPEGALQTVLARQIVWAAWRLGRVERMEAETLIFRDRGECDLGLAATRDANTARALPTLVRYRAAGHAELLRSLRALETLRAEAAKTGVAPDARSSAARLPRPAARATAAPGRPNEPGAVANARPNGPATRPPVAVARPNEPGAVPDARPAKPEMRAAAAPAGPNEPEPGAGPRLRCVMPEPAESARALREEASPWLARSDAGAAPNEPEPRRGRGPDQAGTGRAPAAGNS